MAGTAFSRSTCSVFDPRSPEPRHRNGPRLRFQLASLMDLLLIIVFAQFLEFEQSRDELTTEARQAVDQRREQLADEYDARRGELESLRSELQRQNEALRRERDAALTRAVASRRETELAVETIAGLLQVSPEAFPASDASAAAREAVQTAVRRGEALRDTTAAELLRFLVGYDELLKRAEVWTLHVSDRGDIAVDNGNHEVSFRLESDDQASRTDEFVDRMMAAAQSFAEPKGLVVVLASYSPEAVAGNYQPMIDGLPLAIERLTVEAAGQSRFEAAVVGPLSDPERDLPRPQPAAADTPE